MKAPVSIASTTATADTGSKLRGDAPFGCVEDEANTLVEVLPCWGVLVCEPPSTVLTGVNLKRGTVRKRPRMLSASETYE